MASRDENELFGRALKHLGAPMANSIDATRMLLYLVLGGERPDGDGMAIARRALLTAYKAVSGVVPVEIAERFATPQELANRYASVVPGNSGRGVVKICC